jgi:hypothetical protein
MQIIRLIAKFNLLLLISACFILINQVSAATTKPTVQEMQNVNIEGHFFTTEIANSQRTTFITDPSQARYIILILSLTLEKGDGKIFPADFMLRYFYNDNSEMHHACEAITVVEAQASENLYDLGEFSIGGTSWITGHCGKNRIAISCPVAAGIDSIDLYLLGNPEPLTYRIGTDRLYSVFITTNNDDAKTLLRAKKIIQKGGYNVIETSNGLVGEKEGITIHYRERAESQAREISQRLMTEFGKTPEIKKMTLIAYVDIVIWLGK